MKIRVLCPYCASARIIEYKDKDHKIVSCVKSPCRRLFAVIQHFKTVVVYSLQHVSSSVFASKPLRNTVFRQGGIKLIEVPFQRTPPGFSRQPYSCGFCGMYHRKESSCSHFMRPCDFETGLLGFHDFYGNSYLSENFNLDQFIGDYLGSDSVFIRSIL